MSFLATAINKLNLSQKIATEINEYMRALQLRGGLMDNSQNFQADSRLENLGLDSSNQMLYPDLMEFIHVNQLTDYMEGANLKFTLSDSGEPQLPVNGSLMEWKEIYKLIFKDHDHKSPLRLPESWRFIKKRLRKCQCL